MMSVDREQKLNVADWEQLSVANGPGQRFVLWVQGCPFSCPNCFNRDFAPFVDRHQMTVDEVAATIQQVPNIEGVTFSGGEPMSQAEALCRLSQRLQTSRLSIVCYTGFTIEELRLQTDPWVHRLLGCVDVLIDGRYDETKHANLTWRGSTNQRVHFLTDRYRHLEAKADQLQSEMEFILGKDGFRSTGIINEEFVRRLEQVLNDGPEELC